MGLFLLQYIQYALCLFLIFNLIMGLQDINLLCGVSQDQTVCLEVRQSVSKSDIVYRNQTFSPVLSYPTHLLSYAPSPKQRACC